MMRARVVHRGRLHVASPHPAGLVLDDGRTLAEDEVVWLAPIVPRTIFAVGLNYADHAKELAFKPQTEPLVFLKGHRSIAGHRAATERPAHAAFMHYECELAAVIGRSARRVPAAAALDYVAGYMVANDYAVRDYLENYYRPNLRAKSRDGATPLGPWLVDAADVPDPQALDLRTSVNGKVMQRGNTRDMIYGVAQLIEYLSAFMTLSPGDVILTGTPEGVCNVVAGDEVTTEIDGIGHLHNFLVAGPSRPAHAVAHEDEVMGHG
jgi:5-oxopent-3-ene-1,2,5-tricarboxylate decarboxylase / 2-hydroxyhepta-2,4-diene-1,7-dioate isomerase